MFDRFPGDARQVFAQALKQSQRWRHDFIDVDHILLGLLGAPESMAVKVLNRLGIDREALQAACESALVQGEHGQGRLRQIPFTPEAKKLLEAAMSEANRLSHRHIGTEHLLLGLFTVATARIAAPVAALGKSLDEVRAAVAAVVQVQPG